MLTEDERKFLRDQKIPPDDVYDARNQPKSYWQKRAKELGKNFIIGSPCQAANHRLRTRAGHCIQCNTSQIAYQKREDIEQFLYIAVSMTGKLAKVGSTNDHQRREIQLNKERYGGFSDWIEIFHARVKYAAEIERIVGQRLVRYKVGGNYIKSGKAQVAYEMFNCSYELALFEIYNALKEKNVLPEQLYLHPGHENFALGK